MSMLAAWELNQVLSRAMHANRYCATALPPDMGTQLINFNCKATWSMESPHQLGPRCKAPRKGSGYGYRLGINLDTYLRLQFFIQ